MTFCWLGGKEVQEGKMKHLSVLGFFVTSMTKNKKYGEMAKKMAEGPKNLDPKLNARPGLSAYSRHEYFHGIWYNEFYPCHQGYEEGYEED